MRFLAITLFGLMSTLSALAAEPGYNCQPERGCKELQGPTYELGRGATISLPKGWKVYSYPTAPDPIMEGLREIRAINDGLVIAISPFPNIDHRDFPEETLCEMMKKAGSRYVPVAKELVVTPVPASREGVLVSCKVSFTAKNEGEKPFSVLPNRRHASVTSMVIAYQKDVVFSVSLVSERAPDEAYQAATSALEQIQ